jgi:hypothetical protein
VPIAVSPTDANLVLIGGAGNGTCSRVYARSTNGAATFTGAGVADVGMHADAHAIEFAPSNPSIVYQGNDGGIWRSIDGGATFTSMNTAGFSATQFQSIDVHPTDPYFTIGGTQDNGTPHYTPLQTWNRIDFGDGGFAVIDQNAPDVVNVRMYHTYFNQRSNLVGYARVLGIANAFDGNWTLLGAANGIALTENPNFYAPLVRGPGNPNTVYYATDRLHRSNDQGTTNPIVSQAPIQTSGGLGVPISAVAIASSNDNVRLVGLNPTVINQLWGTTTGSSVLTNMLQAGCRTSTSAAFAIDPTNTNIAYVCYGGFGLDRRTARVEDHELDDRDADWAASGTGLPDVPVNAFVIDPLFPTTLFAGTDVGVYLSTRRRRHLEPVHDRHARRDDLRHGAAADEPHPARRDPRSRHVGTADRSDRAGRNLARRSRDRRWSSAHDLVRVGRIASGPQPVSPRRAGDWAPLAALQADAQGWITYDDMTTESGRSYEYRIGVMDNGNEVFAGHVWVDVPAAAAKFALKSLVGEPVARPAAVLGAAAGAGNASRRPDRRSRPQDRQPRDRIGEHARARSASRRADCRPASTGPS